jgi:hypothetical protein
MDCFLEAFLDYSRDINCAGDFGNEAISLVADIAGLDLPKAAILGNHDAW